MTTPRQHHIILSHIDNTKTTSHYIILVHLHPQLEVFRPYFLFHLLLFISTSYLLLWGCEYTYNKYSPCLQRNSFGVNKEVLYSHVLDNNNIYVCYCSSEQRVKQAFKKKSLDLSNSNISYLLWIYSILWLWLSYNVLTSLLHTAQP